jgi:hypothetical protein
MCKLGVTTQTIWNWCCRYKAFFDAVKVAKKPTTIAWFALWRSELSATATTP